MTLATINGAIFAPIALIVVLFVFFISQYLLRIVLEVEPWTFTRRSWLDDVPPHWRAPKHWTGWQRVGGWEPQDWPKRPAL